MKCFGCGVNLNKCVAATPDSTTPMDGSVAICFYCNDIAIFTKGGKDLRKPTEEEKKEILQLPQIRLVLALIDSKRS